jgi:hypothetical protein
MKGASESRVQSEVRLEAAQKHKRLFRNNVGAMKDANGVPVRYGLANDSKALNEELKSGDLIGWESVLITQDMVGMTLARFLSVECKAEDWKPRPNDPREIAQRRWADLVNAAGGRALIVNAPGSL